MKRVKNELLKKEFKKINQNLIVGIISFILAIICTIAFIYEDGREPKDTKYLNDVIEKENNAADVASNLKISKVYSKVAVNNSKPDYGLYVVGDNKYYYLVFMENKLYAELLNNSNLEKEPYTIYGKTKKTDASAKQYTVEWYNQNVKKDDQIKSSEFESYFGGVYLDSSETIESPLLVVLAIVDMLASLFAFAFILVFIIRKIQTESTLKKISDEELEKLEKELDDKDTFHYERAHLILTKNHIISLTGKMLVTTYKDLVWIYEYRLRQYGITTNKSLMAMLKNGKVKALLQVDGVTKKSTSIINEVVETIISKNPKLLVGYTKENRTQAKEIVKESK